MVPLYVATLRYDMITGMAKESVGGAQYFLYSSDAVETGNARHNVMTFLLMFIPLMFILLITYS